MIEISAKLVSPPVYLSGEIVECVITFCHTTQPEHRISQSHSDILESLAWASAQIHCYCATSGVAAEAAARRGNADTNTSKIRSSSVSARGTSLHSASSGDLGRVVIETKPVILFCDLTIPLGDTVSFVYRETLPLEAPPSYRGSSVKYSYKLTVAAQRVGSRVHAVRLPLRVLPLAALIQAGDAVGALCGAGASTDDLHPTSPFSDVRKADTPLETALQALQNLTARRSPNFYMITNARGKVARFCIFKSAYKLGEDIVGTFDFSIGTVTCMQVSVSLQSEEEIARPSSPKSPRSSPNSSNIVTYTRYHEVTLGLSQSQLILSIPLYVTPAFETDIVSLKWRLHFEFVTTTSPDVVAPNGVSDWTAPIDIPIETMVWNLPIRLYSTLPRQISQGTLAPTEHTLVIK